MNLIASALGLSLRDFRKTRPGLFERIQKVETEVYFASVAKITVYLFTLFGKLSLGGDPSPLDQRAMHSGQSIREPVVATVAL